MIEASAEMFVTLMVLLSAVVLLFVLALGYLFVRNRRREFADATQLCQLILSTSRGRKHGASQAETSQVIRKAQACEIVTTDGVVLRGNYLRTPAPVRLGVIAYCPQFGGDCGDMLDYLGPLLQDGFDVFAFDFRNHGDSDRVPDYSPRAWVTRHELNDLLTVIDYLCDRPDADPQGVALMGVSRGGIAAVCAAVVDPRIWAVATDSVSVSDWLVGHFVRRYMPNVTPLAPLLVRLPRAVFDAYGKLLRCIVARNLGHECLDLAAAIAVVQQPILLIHGMRDRFVPVELAHRLHRTADRRSRLWVVPRAGHCESVYVAPERYRRRLRQFFMRCPQPTARSVAVPADALSSSVAEQSELLPLTSPMCK